jgi:hypothetical protein
MKKGHVAKIAQKLGMLKTHMTHAKMTLVKGHFPS